MKRKVLFLIPSLQGGGAERVLVTILRHLDRERFELALAVLDGRAPAYFDDLPPDVRFVDLRCRRARYSPLAIAALIWRLRPDVVMSSIGHLNLTLAALKSVLPPGVRLIGRETAVISSIIDRGAPGRAWYLLYRRLYRRFDLLICQSEEMRRSLVDELRIPVDKTVVIHNPVDVDHVRRLGEGDLPSDARLMRPDAPFAVRLVAAGRACWDKGFDILINAMDLLREKSVCLTILGEGELRNDLMDQVSRLGLTDTIQVAGFQSNPYAFFSRASAFVLSSRIDSFPNVVLEALACGTPVIATPAQGGIGEILRDIPGCVIAEEVSARALADAIAAYPFGEQHPRPSRAAHFAVDHVVPQYAAVFS